MGGEATARVHDGLTAGAGGITPVYAIFEGGGAKGITHIGAYKALVEDGLRPIGVAGTSAGAIIAALIAVGYEPDELIDPPSETDILKRDGKSPLDLLGRRAWRRYCWIRDGSALLIMLVLAGTVSAHWPLGGFMLLALHSVVRLWSAARRKLPRRRFLLRVLPAAIATAVWYVVFLWLAPPGLGFVAAGAAGLAGLVLVALVWPVIWRRGLFDPGPMKETLNDLLRSKLEEHYRLIGRPVDELREAIRFRHLKGISRCVPLKIIVANARTGRLRLFDEHDETVAIADAVAASAAIPFFFRSPAIRGVEGEENAIYVDGGLISNLPSWAFREEKRAWERRSDGPPVPIIAFTLSDVAGEAPRGKMRFLDYAGKVFGTALFGSQKVLQDFVSDLIVVDLPTSLTTLGFNCKRAEAHQAYEAGAEEARSRLRRDRLFTRVTFAALQEFGNDVVNLVAQRRGVQGQAVPQLRFNVIDPVERRASPVSKPWAIAYRVVAGAGMDADADDRLELDPSNDAAPLAFASARPTYVRLRGRTPGDLFMTKYEHALVSKNVESVLCIPIYPHRDPRALPERVVCIDSTDLLEAEFQDKQFLRNLEGRAALLSRTLLEELASGV